MLADVSLKQEERWPVYFYDMPEFAVAGGEDGVDVDGAAGTTQFKEQFFVCWDTCNVLVQLFLSLCIYIYIVSVNLVCVTGLSFIHAFAASGS